jgi:lipopolysaccharide export system permease protein
MFIMLYIVIDLFDKVNEMIENNVDLMVLFPYYLSYVPLIFVQITPIAVLIAIMYSLGTFSKYNEITAMQASGISLLRILAPLIVAGFLISVIVFIVNDRLVPESTINASEIKEERIEAAKKEKKRKRGEKILENIAFYGEGNKIIYARRYSKYADKINDLIVHAEDDNQNIVSKTTATEAEWRNNRWYGKNIMFFHLDNTGRIIGEPEFYEERYLNIMETPVDFKKRRHQADFMSFEFMSFKELKEYIERLSFESGPTIRNLQVALHQKIAFPFVSLIVVLIASPFALVHTRKGGVLVGVGISIALVLGYYALMTISLAMGKAGFLPPVIATWLTNVLFAFIGFQLIIRHK